MMAARNGNRICLSLMASSKAGNLQTKYALHFSEKNVSKKLKGKLSRMTGERGVGLTSRPLRKWKRTTIA